MLSKVVWSGSFVAVIVLAGCDGGAGGSAGDGGAGGGDTTASTGGADAGGSDAGGSDTGGSDTGGSGAGGMDAGRSCAELQDCYAGCTTDACVVECYESGTPEAKALDDAMYACIAQQGCAAGGQVDADCAYAKCGAEIAACLGGSAGCDPPCPAGSECNNGQCAPVAAGPACDPSIAQLTVNTLLSCVEAKSAIDGKCDVANMVWDGITCCSRMSSCALELYEAPCSVCLVSAAVDATTCNYGGFDLSACFQ